jgi:hypothetical protein
MEGINHKTPSITLNELWDKLRKKGGNHRSYKMYSQIDLVISTIDNKALYLFNGSRWNDKMDSNNFNQDGYNWVNFGRCFSYLTTESVAMWMLYGGTQHQGAMIDFDKSSILKILKCTEKISVGYFGSDGFHSVKDLNKPDFNIDLIDMVYVDNDKNGIASILRRADDVWHYDGDFYKDIDVKNETNKNEKKEKFTFIHKKRAWDYEHECRLIVSIKKQTLSGENDDISVVKIDLKDVNFKNTRIVYAPNIEDEYKKESKFVETVPSALTQSISWDLCEKCKICEKCGQCTKCENCEKRDNCDKCERN